MYQVITHDVHEESMSMWKSLAEAVRNYLHLQRDYALVPISTARVFRCQTTGQIVVLEVVEVKSDD